MNRCQIIGLISLLGLALLALPASAELCAIDEVPAATLLVPFFEVDLAADVGAGANTLVDIANASPDSTIAHVTVWTDWALPLIDFQLYLTGYDVQTLDLYDVFVNGNLPNTHRDNVFHGPLSQPSEDAEYGDCDLFLPFYINPVIGGQLLVRVQEGLAGRPIPPSELCIGSDRGTDIAIGYLTIDTVKTCSTLFPSDDGYFDADGIIAHQNRLLGQFRTYDPTSATDQLFSAVHIEADAQGELFQAGDRTFYGRYVNGDASDRREPLPTFWSSRYVDAEVPSATRYRVWREATPDLTQPFGETCGMQPDAYPLKQEDLLVFDEQENVVVTGADFPIAVSELSTSELSGITTSGWILFDESHQDVIDLYGDDQAQSWIIEQPVLPSSDALGHAASPVATQCLDYGFVRTELFRDSFESGDCDRWSGCVGD